MKTIPVSGLPLVVATFSIGPGFSQKTQPASGEFGSLFGTVFEWEGVHSPAKAVL